LIDRYTIDIAALSADRVAHAPFCLPAACLCLYSLHPPSHQMYPGMLQRADGSDRGNLPRANIGLLQSVDVGGNGWTQAAFYSAQWLSVLCLYVLTALVLTLLRASWKRVLAGRERRMVSAAAASAADPSYRAVLVLGTRVRPAAEAARLWRGTFGEAILAVRMVRDASTLRPLVARCFKQADEVRALDARVAKLQGMPNSEAARDMSDAQEEARAERLAAGEARQAAARHRRDCELAKAEEARTALDVPERDEGAAYFVIFESLVAAATARQTFQAAAVRGLVSAAPPPEEVNWAVLQPAVAARVRIQQTVASAAFVAMLLLFSIPVWR